MDVITKVRGSGLRIAYIEKTGKVQVEPADQLGADLRAEIVARRDEIVAGLMAEAESSDQAWDLMGLSGPAHITVLVADLPADVAEPIKAALTKGLALLGELEGPVPEGWVTRMQELHRTALDAHWTRFGDVNRGALYQVISAIPMRGGGWLEEGLKWVDDAQAAQDRAEFRRASYGVVDAAVAHWLRARKLGLSA